MNIYNLFKYFFRFFFLQVSLTFITIWYFDNFLIGDYFDGFLFIRDNLLEDRSRFYPFVPYDFIKIDAQGAEGKILKGCENFLWYATTIVKNK